MIQIYQKRRIIQHNLSKFIAIYPKLSKIIKKLSKLIRNQELFNTIDQN